jgi:hypothetical protein
MPMSFSRKLFKRAKKTKGKMWKKKEERRKKTGTLKLK